MSACRNCGTRMPDDCPPNPIHCGDCPPWDCDDCGEPDSMSDPCGCWQTLDGMNTADLKALFARDGLSIN